MRGETKPRGYKEMSSILADQGALVYEPKCGGGVVAAGSQPQSTAVHRSPNKFGDLTTFLTYEQDHPPPTHILYLLGWVGGIRNQREDMGLLEYQAMPSLCDEAHDGVL